MPWDWRSLNPARAHVSYLHLLQNVAGDATEGEQLQVHQLHVYVKLLLVMLMPAKGSNGYWDTMVLNWFTGWSGTSRANWPHSSCWTKMITKPLERSQKQQWNRKNTKKHFSTHSNLKGLQRTRHKTTFERLWTWGSWADWWQTVVRQTRLLRK